MRRNGDGVRLMRAGVEPEMPAFWRHIRHTLPRHCRAMDGVLSVAAEYGDPAWKREHGLLSSPDRQSEVRGKNASACHPPIGVFRRVSMTEVFGGIRDTVRMGCRAMIQDFLLLQMGAILMLALRRSVKS